jgi:hypothetical protein
MSFFETEQLALIELYGTRELGFLVDGARPREHTLDRPSLAYASDRIRFVGSPAAWDAFLDVRLSRLVRTTEARAGAFMALMVRYVGGLRCLEPGDGMQLFCERFEPLREAYFSYALRPDLVPVPARVGAYDLLRQEGVVAPDPAFLAAQAQELAGMAPADPAALRGSLEAILAVCAKDGLWDEARRALDLLAQRGLIDAQYHQAMISELDRGRQGRDAFVARFGG